MPLLWLNRSLLARMPATRRYNEQARATIKKLSKQKNQLQDIAASLRGYEKKCRTERKDESAGSRMISSQQHQNALHHIAESFKTKMISEEAQVHSLICMASSVTHLLRRKLSLRTLSTLLLKLVRLKTRSRVSESSSKSFRPQQKQRFIKKRVSSRRKKRYCRPLQYTSNMFLTSLDFCYFGRAAR